MRAPATPWWCVMPVPRDCSYRHGGAPCTAPTRWQLIGPNGLPIIPVCNVHRAPVADLVVGIAAGGWSWGDRRGGGVHAAHRSCLALSSIGRRQTCQGAGSPSTVGCPLTGDWSPGSPQEPARGESLVPAQLSEGGPGSGAEPQGRRWWGRRLHPVAAGSPASTGAGFVLPVSPEDGPEWLSIE
jgi:hypothetical protein